MVFFAHVGHKKSFKVDISLMYENGFQAYIQQSDHFTEKSLKKKCAQVSEKAWAKCKCKRFYTNICANFLHNRMYKTHSGLDNTHAHLCV